MSRLKKITIMIIILLIGIIGFSTKSEAKIDWNDSKHGVGEKESFGFSQDYDGSQRFYCVQHGQTLRSSQKKYTCTSYVKIVGNVATDHKGNSVSDWVNAKMAYILSKNSNHAGDKDKDQVANAIWCTLGDWGKKVASKLKGVSVSFVDGDGGRKKYCKSLLSSAESYANSLQGQTQITCTTNVASLSKVPCTINGRSYIRIGPFRLSFSGKLSGVTVKNQNSVNVGAYISRFVGTSEQYISASSIISGQDFYISVPGDGSVSKINRIDFTATRSVITAEMWFLKCSSSSWQNLLRRAHSTTNMTITGSVSNIPLIGNLGIVKVNSKNTSKVLPNVGFKIQQSATGKYVRVINGSVSYVSSGDATVFKTGVDGKIMVNNLLIGKYKLYEVSQPNYGYKPLSGAVEIQVNAGSNGIVTIKNEQIYVRLSGFVWVDVPQIVTKKEEDRNALYKQQYKEDDKSDTQDLLFDGITVRLKDRSGNTIKETVTSNLDRYKGNGHNGHGEYLFIDVLTEELDKGNYYIEFEYDGLTYQNVIPPYINEDNGSKASEPNRDEFNRNFTYVEAGDTENTGITKDIDGNKVYDLGYDTSVNHYATLNTVGQYKIEDEYIYSTNNNGEYKIVSTTDQAGYSIKNSFKWGEEEIYNINLGVYEREKPDLEIVKDIENVRLDLNGHGHIYKYANRFQHENESYDGEEFSAGVKFGQEYSEENYTQAIYKSDYEYENTEDSSKELQVRIVYKLEIKNRCSNLLKARVNSIIEYYDKGYELEGIGTKLNENGILENNDELAKEEAGEDGKYNKVIINIEEDSETGTVTGGDRKNIYVQYKLDRNAVKSIIETQANSSNRKVLLDSISEINSYSILDENDNIYAGIDSNSAPGNADPDNIDKYENDTELAPALKLEVVDARQLNGKVFLDEAIDENGQKVTQLRTGKIRQGNGQYDVDSNESGMAGVQVKLEESVENNKQTYITTTVSEKGEYGFDQDEEGKWTCEKVTDPNKKYQIKKELDVGEFLLPGYVPGTYTLTYTWGDNKYTVQEYKGTVYIDQDRYQSNLQNKKWYKYDDTRRTDAIDDYTIREAIDEELKRVKNDSKTSITKMESSTPEMEMEVELDDTTETFGADRLPYIVNNVDFGIIERARQAINLDKSISRMKVTLANGQTIADFTIDEDGTLHGARNSVTYMKPDQNSNGFVKLEMDNELIQGTTLEVEYNIKVTNTSEIDIVNKNFYWYGEDKDGEIVTITPSKIVDYSDRDWSFDEDKNRDETNNNEILIQTVDDINKDERLLDESVYRGQDTKISDKLILVTNNLQNEKIKPGESKSLTLEVSKQLTTTDEISLDNESEILVLEKTGGSKMNNMIPGNYVPGLGNTEPDSDIAETTIVTPSTGGNKNYIIIVTTGILSLIVLGVGIVVIKKKII